MEMDRWYRRKQRVVLHSMLKRHTFGDINLGMVSCLKTLALVTCGLMIHSIWVLALMPITRLGTISKVSCHFEEILVPYLVWRTMYLQLDGKCQLLIHLRTCSKTWLDGPCRNEGKQSRRISFDVCEQASASCHVIVASQGAKKRGKQIEYLVIIESVVISFDRRRKRVSLLQLTQQFI